MIKIGILTILLIGYGSKQIEALRCYSCSYTTSSGEEKCVSDPQSVTGQNIVTCYKKYCTITRQEMMDPKGKINSFTRGCEETPLYLDEVIEDNVFKNYYRSCNTDLCNSGDGTKSGTSALSSSSGAGDNLLVKGIDGGSTQTQTCLGLISVSLIISIKNCVK